MDIQRKILELVEDPHGLEKLYRHHPEGFAESYKSVLADHPTSLLLRAWQERLEYKPAQEDQPAMKDVLIMVVFGLVAGSILKIPEWTVITKTEFYPRYMALVPFAAMLGHALYMRNWPTKTTLLSTGVTLLTAGFMPLVPSWWENVYALSCLHLPFFLWCLYGLARTDEQWAAPKARIKYIRFSGELCIHAGLLFLGGGILMALTIGLFELLRLPSSWVFDYVAVYGMASIPLVAAWATDTYSAARRIVPLMARIFAPLLLVLIIAYMAALAWNIDELFRDRATLLTYNILLLSVLGTAVFTLTGRREHGESGPFNGIIFLMLAITLILDIIGLCAIGWRIAEYGLTVNKLAVLGSNLAVVGNLAVMCQGYIRHFQGKGTLKDVEKGIARYLPVYLAWTACVVFVLPWVFRY